MDHIKSNYIHVSKNKKKYQLKCISYALLNFQCQLYYLHHNVQIFFWPKFSPSSKISRQ